MLLCLTDSATNMNSFYIRKYKATWLFFDTATNMNSFYIRKYKATWLFFDTKNVLPQFLFTVVVRNRDRKHERGLSFHLERQSVEFMAEDQRETSFLHPDQARLPKRWLVIIPEWVGTTDANLLTTRLTARLNSKLKTAQHTQLLTNSAILSSYEYYAYYSDYQSENNTYH